VAHIVGVTVPLAEVSESVIGPACPEHGGMVGATGDAVVGSASVGRGDFDGGDHSWMPVQVDADQDATRFVRVCLCGSGCHGGVGGLGEPQPCTSVHVLLHRRVHDADAMKRWVHRAEHGASTYPPESPR
jgi:hypothetical protein